jgi:hypothetical protein
MVFRIPDKRSSTVYVYKMLHENSWQKVMSGQTNIRTIMKNTVLLHNLN